MGLVRNLKKCCGFFSFFLGGGGGGGVAFQSTRSLIFVLTCFYIEVGRRFYRMPIMGVV